MEYFSHALILECERLYDNVSIVSAELNATIMALERLMNNKPLIPNLRNIMVYSDSLSSLELLSSASQYKMDIDTFHCLSIIDNLASRGIFVIGKHTEIFLEF